MRVLAFHTGGRKRGKKPRLKKIERRLPAWLTALWASPRQRRALIFGLAILLCLGIFSLSPPGYAILTSASRRDLPIYSVKKDSKVLSLSFDAAWGNEDTQQLIDILAKYKVQATFFVVGEWVDKFPDSVKALYDAGHEVMNHSASHAHYPKLSESQILADLKACNDKIEAVTGVRPHLFRPPYGDYNDKVVATVRSAGMYTIQWDVDSLDWKDLKAADIEKRVLGRVKPGSIVLFHNAAKNTPEALPSIIEGLIQQGYGFVPISKLILTESYEIDPSGMQYPAGSA